MSVDPRSVNHVVRRWGLATALAVAACVGCGRGEPVARLTGVVVVRGAQPKAPLMVVAENKARGISAAALVDAAGRFEVLTAPGRGVPEGTYRIALIAPPRAVGDIAAGIGKGAPARGPDAGVPARFGSPETSGLTVDVRVPETRFDITVPAE